MIRLHYFDRSTFFTDIDVKGMNTMYMGMSANLTCTLSNFKQRHLRQIIIQKATTKTYITSFYPKKDSPRCNTNRHGNTYTKSCFDWTVNDTLRVIVNFDVFTCSLSGMYECIVVLNNMNTHTKSGLMQYVGKLKHYMNS